jgi:hypothetical protein
MTWERAPREVKGSDLVWRIWLLGLAWGYVISDRSWWSWTIAILATALFPVVLLAWLKDYRAYRAWVKWDEAGGPDASPRPSRE